MVNHVRGVPRTVLAQFPGTSTDTGTTVYFNAKKGFSFIDNGLIFKNNAF